MSKVVAGITISLDGFINGPDGKVEKLNPDFAELHDTPSFQTMVNNTGAAIMGRHTYEMADPFMWANEGYELQVPIFVLTHTSPAKFPPGNGKLRFIFITDGVESAVVKAKRAAGNKDVWVAGGANVIQQLLNDGLCDELQIDLMPVLLGSGLRLFENLDTNKVKLERTKAEKTTSMRTSITFTKK